MFAFALMLPAAVPTVYSPGVTAECSSCSARRTRLTRKQRACVRLLSPGFTRVLQGVRAAAAHAESRALRILWLLVRPPLTPFISEHSFLSCAGGPRIRGAERIDAELSLYRTITLSHVTRHTSHPINRAGCGLMRQFSRMRAAAAQFPSARLPCDDTL